MQGNPKRLKVVPASARLDIGPCLHELHDWQFTPMTGGTYQSLVSIPFHAVAI
jgi:hypothetical protein